VANNIFKNEKKSMLPYIVVGAVLILAIICVTIIGRIKEARKYEPFDITEDMVTIPPEDPYEVEPQPETLDDGIINISIEDYADSIIEGSDLTYLLSTMDDTYAYLISTESINRLQSVKVGDLVVTAYVENEGAYTSRLTKDSSTGNYHDEIFLNVGHTIDGMTSIRWDRDTKSFYTSGTLRLADIAKIVYDADTGERYRDVLVPMFVSWDFRGAFKDDDQFYVRKLYSTEDGSLIGYVFEQTSIQFVGEDGNKETEIIDENTTKGSAIDENKESKIINNLEINDEEDIDTEKTINKQDKNNNETR